MRKPIVRTGAAAIIAGVGSRLVGLAFGKAIAFTYAVIVSVVANVVFTLVRDPPHTAPPESFAAAVPATGSGAARATLPRSPQAAAAALAPDRTQMPAALPASPAPPPDDPHPGPGSGGLY